MQEISYNLVQSLSVVPVCRTQGEMKRKGEKGIKKKARAGGGKRKLGLRKERRMKNELKKNVRSEDSAVTLLFVFLFDIVCVSFSCCLGIRWELIL